MFSYHLQYKYCKVRKSDNESHGVEAEASSRPCRYEDNRANLAASCLELGVELMQLLLDRRRSEIKITEGVLQTALLNWQCSGAILKASAQA